MTAAPISSGMSKQENLWFALAGHTATWPNLPQTNILFGRN